MTKCDWRWGALAIALTACSSSSGGGASNNNNNVPPNQSGGTGDAGPSVGKDAAPGGQGATALSVDCTKNENAGDIKCKTPSPTDAGKLGSGPTFINSPGFPEVRSGFVDDARGRLVVAVELGSQDDDQGIVLAVDLTTGDRTMISGKYADPAKGDVVKGAGNADLGYIRDVQPLHDGSLVAIVNKGTQSVTQLVKIDPSTGDRTIIADGVVSNAPGYKCTFDDHTDVVVTPSIWTVAIGANDEIYLALEGFPAGTGWGMVKITPTPAGTPAGCSVLSYKNDADAGHNKGTGPIPSSGEPRAMRFRDGKIWLIDDLLETLYSVDPATGNWLGVSSHKSMVGSGDAEIGRTSLDFDPSGSLITQGPFVNGFVLTRVDVSSGARTGYVPAGGPAGAGIGAWHVPGSSLIAIAPHYGGIVLFDPATGNSNNLSF